MKKDLRMNAKSPDPDDLTNPEPPQPAALKGNENRGKDEEKPNPDLSAPHIPPIDH